jgi:hypothetical protein
MGSVGGRIGDLGHQGYHLVEVSWVVRWPTPEKPSVEVLVHRCLSLCGEQADGVVGQYAVGAAAVGDDLLIVREVGELVGEFVEGDAQRARDVAGCVLLDHAFAPSQQIQQLKAFTDAQRLAHARELVGRFQEVRRRRTAVNCWVLPQGVMCSSPLVAIRS